MYITLRKILWIPAWINAVVLILWSETLLEYMHAAASKAKSRECSARNLSFKNSLLNVFSLHHQEAVVSTWWLKYILICISFCANLKSVLCTFYDLVWIKMFLNNLNNQTIKKGRNACRDKFVFSGLLFPSVNFHS